MKTYGQVSHDEGRWLIEFDPSAAHVMMRLKRSMAAVAKSAIARVWIADTIDVCRDLEWFFERYPMRFASADDEQRLRSRSMAHRESESLVTRLSSGELEPRQFQLALAPRNYQMVAAELALRLHDLLIADDIGLGKTATSLCVLSDPRCQPALVVTLTHLPIQWEREVKKFLPGMRTHILQGGEPYDLTMGPESRKRDPHGIHRPIRPELPHIIITSYSKIAKWAAFLSPIIKSVVFDEVQELRRGTQSMKGAAAYHLAQAAEFRIGLSATPVNNYGGELYEVMEAIRPGALGTHEEFSREWCLAGYNHLSLRDPEAMGTYLREQGLMIRRTRSEVGRELPPLSKIPYHVDSDTSVLDRIATPAAELARIILSSTAGARGEKRDAAAQLDLITRQATGIAKAPYVADFVRLLVESGEPVLLYGWHRAVYDLWLDRLKDLAPALYTGSESTPQKQAAAKSFIEGKTKLLIMSLRSGQGIDGLQEICRTVVFGELDWSPAIHEQDAGRVYRDGQSDPVCAYYLISDYGSDPIVADVLQLKRAQVEGIRDPNRPLTKETTVDPEHIRKLAASFLAKSS